MHDRAQHGITGNPLTRPAANRAHRSTPATNSADIAIGWPNATAEVSARGGSFRARRKFPRSMAQRARGPHPLNSVPTNALTRGPSGESSTRLALRLMLRAAPPEERQGARVRSREPPGVAGVHGVPGVYLLQACGSPRLQQTQERRLGRFWNLQMFGQRQGTTHPLGRLPSDVSPRTSPLGRFHSDVSTRMFGQGKAWHGAAADRRDRNHARSDTSADEGGRS
jgi:hypothetical protein